MSSAPSGSISAPPTLTDPAAQVEAVLADMDLSQRAAQVILVGLRPEKLDQAPGLVGAGAGGFFLIFHPQQSVEELAGLTGSWAAAAPHAAPWVAADQEGGKVQILVGPGFPVLPSAVVQSGFTSEELRQAIDQTGAAMRDAGVGVNLAPVVDLVDPAHAATNPPIGRQYGADPQDVAESAGLVIDTLCESDVQTVLKHFPGLGSVTGNTDQVGPVIDKTTSVTGPQIEVYRTVLEGRSPECEPFVMVSSATYALIDPSAPAVYSDIVITDVLRAQLGFTGVVMSDDLGKAKSAGDRPVGQRAVDFVSAGGTLALVADPTFFQPMVDALVAEATADPVFAAKLDDAVRVTLLAKVEAGLL